MIKRLVTTCWHAQLAPALGSYLLASQLTGSLYDREAARQKSFDHQCTGSACFRCSNRALPASSMIGTLARWMCPRCHMGRQVMSGPPLGDEPCRRLSRAAFLTCAVLCLLGAGASIILYLRTRALYLAARQPGRCTSSIEVTGTCMVSS